MRDLPVASLAGKRILPELIALVPARLASKHGVIPLFLENDGPKGHLYLGMEDPSDLAVLDDLCFRTGIEIRPIMVRPSEIGNAIEPYYRGRGGGTPQTRSSLASKRVESAPLVAAPISKLPDGLLDDVGRSVEDTEKTRIVIKGITQLLIDKDLLCLEELQVQIASLKAQGSHTGGRENSSFN